MFSPTHFSFIQTNSLDFFSLPTIHSRRVLWLQKTILLEVLQAQVLEDKKPPQLIVLCNCNGAAMAKNNTNQESATGSSMLMWDTKTHLILIETTVPGSTSVRIYFISCHLLLWMSRPPLIYPSRGRSNTSCSIKPTIAEQEEARFKRNSVFSCWMTVSPIPFRKLTWGILTFENTHLVIGYLVAVWGQLILLTDRFKENLPL